MAVPPIFIMFILIALQTGQFSAAGHTICIPNANSNAPCSVTGNAGSITVTCPSSATSPCQIQNQLIAELGLLSTGQLAYCQSPLTVIFGPNPPPPAYCMGQFGFPAWVSPDGNVYLNPGMSVVVSAKNSIAQSVQNCSSTTNCNSISLFFTDITSSTFGFVALVVVGMGIAALTAITLFGSSFTSIESTHILFVGGIMVGLWIILSLAEGFVIGNNSSLLSQMNGLTVGGTQGQFGTITYAILSLLEMIGIVGLVSRGA